MLSVFDYQENKLNILTIKSEQWWIAQEIAKILDYSNATEMIELVDKEDKKVINPQRYSQLVTGDLPVTNESTFRLTIINESGLYSVILRSNKPEAKKFKKWVTAEVLPQIRKTGRYEIVAIDRPLREGGASSLDIQRHTKAIIEARELGDNLLANMIMDNLANKIYEPKVDHRYKDEAPTKDVPKKIQSILDLFEQVLDNYFATNDIWEEVSLGTLTHEINNIFPFGAKKCKRVEVYNALQVYPNGNPNYLIEKLDKRTAEDRIWLRIKPKAE